MPTITYLDYNATTPARSEVAERLSALVSKPHNASSVHFYGREAKKELENAREVVSEAVNCWSNEVIFTASGTEANNTVLKACHQRRLLISAIEHSSIIKTVPEAERIAVTQDGVVDVESLKALLAKSDKPVLVSVMLANNETGVIQPVGEIVKACRESGKDVLVHTDAAQALGKIETDFSSLGVDMMTLSAHKMGGIVGAAALILRNDMPLTPLLTGGGQELGRRAGTENLPAIVAFAQAIQIAEKDGEQMNRLRGWLNAMEDEMLATCPDAVVLGKNANRLPGTTCIAMPHISSETQLMSFDLAGIAVSAGSACSSGRIEPSHVVKAMGVGEDIAGCALRISGGWGTTEDDVKKMTAAWKQLYERVGKKRAGEKA